jgi:hypothetical protein
MNDFATALVENPTDPTMTLLDLLKIQTGVTDTTKDPVYTRALNAAGAAIESWLDTVVLRREVTERFAHHFGTVALKNIPATTLVEVNVGGQVSTDYEWFLSTGGYAYLTRTGIRWDMPMDWRPYEQVDVKYTAGFDPIPLDLSYAIVFTALAFSGVEGKGTAPGGASGDLKQFQLYDVGSVTYDVGGGGGGGGDIYYQSGIIANDIAESIKKYKRMSV